MFKRAACFLPSLTQCWVIVFFLIIVGGVGIGTLLALICEAAGYSIEKLNPAISYIAPLLPAFAYILAAKPANRRPVALNATNFGQLHPAVAYPVLAVTTIALGFVSEPLSGWMPMPEYMKQIFEKILSNSFWSFVTTVIVAPVLEEILLRGVMERGLLHHTTPAKAILWSSFFFAVIHMNPWQATAAFIAGIFFGWIYWRTHSLVACIFIHATNNATAFFIQLLYPNLPATSTYKDLLELYGGHLYYAVFVIFVILLATLLNLLNKKLPKDNFEQSREDLINI